MEVVRDDVLEKLQQLKIPLFIMEAQSFEHVYSHIQTLGRILHRVKDADALVHTMRRDIQAIGDKTKSLPKPRILYVVYHEPFYYGRAREFYSSPPRTGWWRQRREGRRECLSALEHGSRAAKRP